MLVKPDQSFIDVFLEKKIIHLFPYISQVSHLLADKVSEKLIRCYCKKRDESSIEHATKAFKEWREQHCCTVGGKD